MKPPSSPLPPFVPQPFPRSSPLLSPLPPFVPYPHSSLLYSSPPPLCSFLPSYLPYYVSSLPLCGVPLGSAPVGSLPLAGHPLLSAAAGRARLHDPSLPLARSAGLSSPFCYSPRLKLSGGVAYPIVSYY